MIKVIVVAIAIFIWSPAAARAQSMEETSTALRAAKAFQGQYKKAGMAGLAVSVDECYARARQLRTENSALYCYVLDFMASELDSAASKSLGFPVNERSKIENVNARINLVFDVLGFDQSERGQRTAMWSALAHRAFGEIIKGR